MRYFLFVFTLFILVGCGNNPQKPDPTIQNVSVDKPILYCPNPPDVSLGRLVTSDLSPADISEPGKVAKYYKAVVIQLLGEIHSRDVIIQAYKDLQHVQNVNPALKPTDINALFNESIKNEIDSTKKSN
jgi:hypothetical protein